MKITRHIIGAIDTNSWLIESGDEALLIDPADEDATLLESVSQLNLVAVVLTHGHIDHIAGIPPFIKRGIPICIGEQDAAALNDPRLNLSAWMGKPFSAPDCVPRILRDGETLRVGDCLFTVYELPGHSPGSIGLVGNGHCFSGDVLFRASVGRTDLPGGDFSVLQQSILTKLYPLPGETCVHPGHGEDTSIGVERQTNPIVYLTDNGG